FELRRSACLKVFDEQIVIAARQRDGCGLALRFVPGRIVDDQLLIYIDRRTIVRLDRKGVGTAAEDDELARPRGAELFGYRIAPGAPKVVRRRLGLDRGASRGRP